MSHFPTLAIQSQIKISKEECICAQRKVLLGLSEIGCSSSLTYSFYKTTQQEKPFCSGCILQLWTHILQQYSFFVCQQSNARYTGRCELDVVCNIAHGEYGIYIEYKINDFVFVIAKIYCSVNKHLIFKNTNFRSFRPNFKL